MIESTWQLASDIGPRQFAVAQALTSKHLLDASCNRPRTTGLCRWSGRRRSTFRPNTGPRGDPADVLVFDHALVDASFARRASMDSRFEPVEVFITYRAEQKQLVCVPAATKSNPSEAGSFRPTESADPSSADLRLPFADTLRNTAIIQWRIRLSQRTSVLTLPSSLS